MTTIMVTGGAGFVGSALIRHLMDETNAEIVNVDNMGNGSDQDRVAAWDRNTRYHFERKDVGIQRDMEAVLGKHRPTWLFHCAAETQADRSIQQPRRFLQTNVFGSYCMLEAARNYIRLCRPKGFKFIHVSTDEVFGRGDPPNLTPFAATKCAGDSLARAWHSTFDVPVILTHSSANYGPGQDETEPVPLAISRAIHSEAIPVPPPGTASQDWIHISDHVAGLHRAAEMGKPGQVYDFGGNESWTMEQVANIICRALDDLCPRKDGHQTLIEHTAPRAVSRSRPVDLGKVWDDLIWLPRIKLMAGLRDTVAWYVRRYFHQAGIRACA